MSNNQQELPKGSFRVPREYVLEGIKEGTGRLVKALMDSRIKYGKSYNENNLYEDFNRKFGFSDPDRILRAYERVFIKKSELPENIQKVVKEIGDYGRAYAADKYLKEERAKSKMPEA